LEDYERDFEGLTSVSKEVEEDSNGEDSSDLEEDLDDIDINFADNSEENEENDEEKLKINVQAITNQILNLSDLEENSSNLLNLPSQIDEKIDEIIKENEEMKKKLEEEDQTREETHQLTIQEMKDQIKQQEEDHQTRVDEMKAEFKGQIEQQELDHQTRVDEMKTEFNGRVQELDEKDLQREESYNQLRNQHENELQDFRDILGDMDHKVQRLNKRIFHLSLENKSLRSLVSSYHDPSNVSLEDMRAQIEEEMNAIGFGSLERPLRVRFVEIQDQLENEEEELSLQDLQFMLVELQEMNQPTNEN